MFDMKAVSELVQQLGPLGTTVVILVYLIFFKPVPKSAIRMPAEFTAEQKLYLNENVVAPLRQEISRLERSIGT